MRAAWRIRPSSDRDRAAKLLRLFQNSITARAALQSWDVAEHRRAALVPANARRLANPALFRSESSCEASSIISEFDNCPGGFTVLGCSRAQAGSIGARECAPPGESGPL